MVMDSGFVSRGLLELGPLRSTTHGAAWAHLWREFWRLVEEFGGLGEAAMPAEDTLSSGSR